MRYIDIKFGWIVCSDYLSISLNNDTVAHFLKRSAYDSAVLSVDEKCGKLFFCGRCHDIVHNDAGDVDIPIEHW